MGAQRHAVASMDESQQLGVEVAKLRSDVDHVKTDIADIKVDLRRMDDRLTGKIDSLREDLHALREEFHATFASAKIWALGLYFGLVASLLLVMAKGFKWI